MSDTPSRSICATMQHHYALAETDEVYQANRRAIESHTSRARLAPRVDVVRIPVVVHVIYRTAGEHLSNGQIDSQIEALNRDFRMRNLDVSTIPESFRDLAADTLIEFGLAVRDPQGNTTTGVTRTRTSLNGFPYDSSDPQSIRRLDQLIKHDEFGKAAWPRDDYLNLWVCSIRGGLLGYAQFPGGPAASDGVVVHNTAFGQNGIARAPFNLGRTGVHEIGHFFNLLHIWGDDEGGCLGSDNVGDTPNQGAANTRRPTFPNHSCGNEPHGDMFMNYMDYVFDDTMVMFTKGQVRRMNAALSGPRAALTRSRGLLPVETDLVDVDAGFREARESHSLPASSERGSKVEQVFDGVYWV